MCEAEAASSEATAPGLTDKILGGDQVAITGLNELLDHLLGEGTHILADAGLSRFCPRRLSAIQSGAEVQALECLHGLQGMAQVLGVALGHPQAELPATVLTDVVWYFHGQLHAIERWRELAANAAGLLNNRRVAGDIASRYATWALSIGEWPDVDHRHSVDGHFMERGDDHVEVRFG